MNYYLEPGDLLHYPKNSAYGFLVQKIGHTWNYCLLSPSTVDNDSYMTSMYSIDSKTIYRGIEAGRLKVQYGSLNSRRKRKKKS
jgi:hypothetical protein